MKISKLFHWLYVLLMLLPAFFVGGRMAYTIFNKNAKDSYSTNYINKIDNVNSLTSGLEYIVQKNNNVATSPSPKINYTSISIDWTDYGAPINNYNAFYIYSNGSFLLYYEGGNQGLNGDRFWPYIDSFTFKSSVNISLNTNMAVDYYFVNTTEQKLDNAFDYSMSQLNELPLFSWAKDSFIVEPFQYITGLFGVPSNSPISTLLSYWCAISIIWLVFDLLMYVPLLAHRWIDKGVLE